MKAVERVKRSLGRGRPVSCYVKEYEYELMRDIAKKEGVTLSRFMNEAIKQRLATGSMKYLIRQIGKSLQ